MQKYNPQAIEAKWQEKWEEEKTFHTNEEGSGEKYYLLVMFPYPSGRIHMGHVRNYTIGDLIARHQRMLGKNVLHPMGWDAFGMPAENAAIKQQTHPKEWTYRNIETMRRELQSMGLSYDWQRELATCDPQYAHWEQVIFLRLYEKGLIYRKLSLVNWDPVDQTVLANEQVIDGKGWRSGAPVERKELSQWFFKISAYAEELLSELSQMEGWPETVRTMQTNWIGKSHGLEFAMTIHGSDQSLRFFTTRADTIMGVTFCSIAPEHALAKEVAARDPAAAVFIRECQGAGTSAEAVENLEKKGYDTGLKAVHPFTGAEIPIFIANFVLLGYGTGAVMAVPAHDQRDFEFARKYHLPIQVVIQPPTGPTLRAETMDEAYVDPGVLVNSGIFDGLTSAEAKQAVTAALAERGVGHATTTWRLRDWGISRQRYWGNPIPMIHCAACGVVPVPEADLPIPLPEDVTLTGIGNPLDRHPTWKLCRCPRCGAEARRETDTMDTFVESSWYFLRYCCPDYQEGPLDPKRVNYWMPVDQYVGGVEHAVLHLLYARFFHKALRDIGLVSCAEPFTRLLTQGMVRKDTHRCPNHGWRYPNEVKEAHGGLACVECDAAIVVGRNEKMSKSKHNVVDPNDLIAGYGADTARLFMLFAAPPDRDLEWNDAGVDGAWRFLNRVWRLVHEVGERTRDLPPQQPKIPTDPVLREAFRKSQATVAKVSDDIQRFQFNTAIAAVMELVNEGMRLLGLPMMEPPLTPETAFVLRDIAESVVLLLHPMAPHITEELWTEVLGRQGPLVHCRWPDVWKEALVKEEMTIVVQVNGKLRARLTVPTDAATEEIKALALAEPKVVGHLAGGVRQVVYVPGRLVNIVAG